MHESGVHSLAACLRRCMASPQFRPGNDDCAYPDDVAIALRNQSAFVIGVQEKLRFAL